MRASLLTLALVFSLTVAAQTPPHAQQGVNIPKGMKQYFMGFLVKGEKYGQTVQKEELSRLQQQHLAYIRSQAEASKYVLAGPFLENDRIRGVVVINAASAEEAKNIASVDPMVKIGRLAVEIHPMMVPDLSCVQMEYDKSRSK